MLQALNKEEVLEKGATADIFLTKKKKKAPKKPVVAPKPKTKKR
jgi:hypothetical protein